MRRGVRILQDIYDRCDVNSETGCLERKYSKLAKGYGKVRFGPKMELVHRLVYKLANPEKDISKLDICHECDNTSCCNLDHLFAGTHMDNMKDMEMKGRDRKPGPISPAIGEEIGNSKLSTEQVLEIKKVYSEIKITQRSLAKRYDISEAQMSRILNNKHWRHTNA